MYARSNKAAIMLLGTAGDTEFRVFEEVPRENRAARNMKVPAYFM